jgi:carbamate kinase
VGLLALQASAYDEESSYPFDVLGAQTEGMIGYLIEQELGNLLPFDKQLATVLTMVEVDPDDPAMADPTKFVGPVYGEQEARRLAAERGWTVKQDGVGWRRVVPSPVPRRIFEIGPIRTLLENGVVVICTGGGGIPTMYLPEVGATGPGDLNPRTLVGVEAVIDKDRASALLAQALDADLLVVATDTDAVYLDWGTPAQRAIRAASPAHLGRLRFPRGRWVRRWRPPHGSRRPLPGGWPSSARSATWSRCSPGPVGPASARTSRSSCSRRGVGTRRPGSGLPEPGCRGPQVPT